MGMDQAEVFKFFGIDSSAEEEWDWKDLGTTPQSGEVSISKIAFFEDPLPPEGDEEADLLGLFNICEKTQWPLLGPQALIGLVRSPGEIPVEWRDRIRICFFGAVFYQRWQPRLFLIPTLWWNSEEEKWVATLLSTKEVYTKQTPYRYVMAVRRKD